MRSDIEVDIMAGKERLAKNKSTSLSSDTPFSHSLYSPEQPKRGSGLRIRLGVRPAQDRRTIIVPVIVDIPHFRRHIEDPANLTRLQLGSSWEADYEMLVAVGIC